jgi:hypothetical protein
VTFRSGVSEDWIFSDPDLTLVVGHEDAIAGLALEAVNTAVYLLAVLTDVRTDGRYLLRASKGEWGKNFRWAALRKRDVAYVEIMGRFGQGELGDRAGALFNHLASEIASASNPRFWQP